MLRSGKSGWDDGLQIFDLIRSPSEHEHCHPAIRKVLLVFYPLVNGHEDIEFQLSQRQQHTILFSRPPHLLYRSAFVISEQAFQCAWQHSSIKSFIAPGQ